MYKQEIKSQAIEEICCKCKKWKVERVNIGRLDLLNKLEGFIIANDLFDNVICKDCFILHVLNLFNELQYITKPRTKPQSSKKRNNSKGHD